MPLNLDHIEALARASAVTHPGPWSIDGDDDRIDCIRAAPVPVPDYAALGDRRDLPIVLETDCGYYQPRGDLAKFIASCDPSTILRLVAVARAAVDVLAEDDQLVQGDAPMLTALRAAVDALTGAP